MTLEVQKKMEVPKMNDIYNCVYMKPLLGQFMKQIEYFSRECNVKVGLGPCPLEGSRPLLRPFK